VSRHHRAERTDEEPWLVPCTVQTTEGAEQMELRIGESDGWVFLMPPNGKPLWLTAVGHCDVLAHFVLLAANRASYRPRPKST
jgi:hypothetical protein